MSRRMTVVFHDDDLYTNLKVEAVRRRKPASDIVSEAVLEWLESHEDAELLPVIDAARAEWKEQGGRPWTELEREMTEALNTRDSKK
jgi:hypothetical protein